MVQVGFKVNESTWSGSSLEAVAVYPQAACHPVPSQAVHQGWGRDGVTFSLSMAGLR